jgi:hypothetical protein
MLKQFKMFTTTCGKLILYGPYQGNYERIAHNEHRQAHEYYSKISIYAEMANHDQRNDKSSLQATPLLDQRIKISSRNRAFKL